MRRFIPTLLLTAIGTAAGNAQTETEVVTNGQGMVRLAPEWATLQIVVSARADGPSEAAALNSARVDSVRSSLAGWPAVSDSIRITQVRVSPNQDHREGRIIDYQASATVEVDVMELDSIGAAFGRVLESGATQIGTVQYRAEGTEQAREEALRRAFVAARDDARAIAEAAGLRLGNLVSVSTMGLRAPPGSPMPRMEAASAQFVNPTPSDLVVSGMVSATWRLEPADDD